MGWKMFPLRLCSLVLVIFAVLPCQLEGARILAIFPFPGPSQYINVVPYLKALAARGHEVTSVNAFPQKKPVKNFRDIPVLEVFQSYDGAYLYFIILSIELMLLVYRYYIGLEYP